MKSIILLLIASTQIFAQGYISEASCHGTYSDGEKVKLSFQIEEDYFCSEKEEYQGAIILTPEDEFDPELISTKVKVEELDDKSEKVLFSASQTEGTYKFLLQAFYNFEKETGNFKVHINGKLIEDVSLKCDIIFLHIECD